MTRNTLWKQYAQARMKWTEAIEKREWLSILELGKQIQALQDKIFKLNEEPDFYERPIK